MVDRLPEVLEGSDIPEVEFRLSVGFYQLQGALMGHGKPPEVGDSYSVFIARNDEWMYSVYAIAVPEAEDTSTSTFYMVPFRTKLDEDCVERFDEAKGWINTKTAD